MLLHIGGNVALPIGELVAILDASSAQRADTAAHLAQLEAEGRAVWAAPQEPVKSIVLTRDAVYYSPISSVTLHKRCRRGVVPGEGRGL